ncbi:MAG: VWA domain-containing protein [Anaerolineales bacterium]|nr:VWA domain-containing protein [Anaerolineales bacterium]
MKYTGFANRINSNQTAETLLTLIDLSPSMEINDWLPSRLAGAIIANKELINNKLKSFPQDRMGIIGFSGNAKVLHSPVCLGSDSESLKRSLENPVGSGGTNFTAALNLAEECFANKTSQSKGNFVSNMLAELFFETKAKNPGYSAGDNSLKRIILLTDGEHNYGGSPESVASRLKKTGVIIDCIGIGGTPEDVDEALLKKIASRNPDGSIRYCFIGDQDQLIRKYESLATHIMPV